MIFWPGASRPQPSIAAERPIQVGFREHDIVTVTCYGIGVTEKVDLLMPEAFCVRIHRGAADQQAGVSAGVHLEEK